MPPIRTDRLRFREMTPDDVDDLHAMFADDGARRFYPRMRDIAEVRGWIDWNLENYRRHGFGLWAVNRVDTGAFVGDCGLTYQSVDGADLLEIGYHVTAAERGNGFAVEAATAVLAHGFAVTDVGRICSIVAPDNAASIRVAARLHASRRRCTYAGGVDRLLFYTDRPAQPRHCRFLLSTG